MFFVALLVRTFKLSYCWHFSDSEAEKNSTVLIAKSPPEALSHRHQIESHERRHQVEQRYFLERRNFM